LHIPRATVMTDLESYLVLQWDRGKSGFYAQVKKKYIPQPDTAGLGRANLARGGTYGKGH